jgi:hypothetical protein
MVDVVQCLGKCDNCGSGATSMTSNYSIQLLSGAVHNAVPPTPYRVIDYQILWSTHYVSKEMRDWAGKRARELKYEKNLH